jgi:hypothetical protein
VFSERGAPFAVPREIPKWEPENVPLVVDEHQSGTKLFDEITIIRVYSTGALRLP